jgi:hypothetical protein
MLMAIFICLGLVCGALLGARYKVTALILALPVAFAFPCLLAVLGQANLITGLAWVFLTMVGVQLGFLAGGVVLGGTERRYSRSGAPLHRPHR